MCKRFHIVISIKVIIVITLDISDAVIISSMTVITLITLQPKGVCQAEA